MKLHGNARTCPNARALIASRVLDRSWTLTAAAEAAGVSVPTARKWVNRYRAGDRRLLDRSSRPRRIPARTPARRIEAIVALRRLRMTAKEIAEVLGMALSTVSLWLRRVGLGKRSRLEPPEPPNRYERRRPGELVHVDIKQLGRISVRGAGHRVVGHRKSQFAPTVAGHRRKATGFEYVHVMVDDHSRLAYAEVLGRLDGAAAAAFLRRAVAWFAQRGITIERVMTDNGSAYRSRLHEDACLELGLRQLRTRAYRPRTNGKAERFIQTLTNEWAYAQIYGSSAERTARLPLWLDHYNFRRPHGALGHKPPATRVNDLVGNYS
jgi:transposase InsO family protein